MLILAFEGWNDAGEAATQAVEHLIEQSGASPFAWIDPEEFYDFTTTRPQVRIDGDQRIIDWPQNRLLECRSEGQLDVVLLRGVEPQLRWRTFAAQVVEVATTLQARLVLTLGALLADVPHSRPTPVYGTSYDQQVMEALRLDPSSYEGPTGIIGVLLDECRQRGVPSASLWAAVPAYVAAAPSPKAALALVDRVSRLLGHPVRLGGLGEAAVAYEQQISELVSEDPETVRYVHHLEEQHDREREPEDVDRLLAEVERFLRDQ